MFALATLMPHQNSECASSPPVSSLMYMLGHSPEKPKGRISTSEEWRGMKNALKSAEPCTPIWASVCNWACVEWGRRGGKGRRGWGE